MTLQLEHPLPEQGPPKAEAQRVSWLSLVWRWAIDLKNLLNHVAFTDWYDHGYASGDIIIDLAYGPWQKLTVYGNVTNILFINWDKLVTPRCFIQMTAAGSFSFAAPSVRWPGGAYPALAAGDDLLEFWTGDSGVTVDGKLNAGDLDYV